jgi:hypothetical protein
MNFLESFLIHVLQKQNILIDEQRVSDFNPLFELARDITLHYMIPTSGFSLLLISAPHTPNQGKSIKSSNII